jgi:uncharacterized protein DUF3599
MSYRSLLTDRCDIYKVKKSNKVVGYGLEDEVEYFYGDVPDYTNIPCKFNKTSSSQVIENEPGQKIIEIFNVHFLYKTNININDLVVKEGIKYKLMVPLPVKKHHIEVEAMRKD